MPNCRNEKEIFEMLNLPWKEPWERTADIDEDNPLFTHKDSQGLSLSNRSSHHFDYADDEGYTDTLAPCPKKAKK